MGWDKQRQMTLAQQKKMGIVPADTVLKPRPKDIPAWNTSSADEKKVYAHMMEVYAATVAQPPPGLLPQLGSGSSGSLLRARE
jgi:arylsulfatase A-like enzyme